METMITSGVSAGKRKVGVVIGKEKTYTSPFKRKIALLKERLPTCGALQQLVSPD